MKKETNIKLGDKAKDRITGLTGIVTSRHEFLNGCVRMGIQPQELKDGKPVESSVFDVEQLELVTEKVEKKGKPGGGPMPDPPSRITGAR